MSLIKKAQDRGVDLYIQCDQVDCDAVHQIHSGYVTNESIKEWCTVNSWNFWLMGGYITNLCNDCGVGTSTPLGNERQGNWTLKRSHADKIAGRIAG